MATSVLQPTPLSTAPILVLSPSSISHPPTFLNSLLTTFLPYDFQVIDPLAPNLVTLPPSHYTEAVLVLPTSEELDLHTDFQELTMVFPRILDTMCAGGRLRIGRPNGKRLLIVKPTAQITREAILTGFVVETANNQVRG
jgi:hypothetical protein